MKRQEFEYSSAAGVEYKLVVTERGFAFYDKKTDELLIDASILVNSDGQLGYWAIECNMSTSNREFYFSHQVKGGERDFPVVEFGISKRE